jgi:predicted polyphosphate/ATP-dependent NAD kinase
MSDEQVRKRQPVLTYVGNGVKNVLGVIGQDPHDPGSAIYHPCDL